MSSTEDHASTPAMQPGPSVRDGDQWERTVATIRDAYAGDVDGRWQFRADLSTYVDEYDRDDPPELLAGAVVQPLLKYRDRSPAQTKSLMEASLVNDVDTITDLLVEFAAIIDSE